MKTSRDRILTTHVGSLPRPDDVAALLIAKERGEPYDVDALDAAVRSAVRERVLHQVEVGIDVVSDGETSKIGYATYIKDRLSGFGGEHTVKPHLDMKDHGDLRQRMVAFTGPQQFKRLCCTGPVELVDGEAVHKDIATFAAALDNSGAVEGFMNAASPGLVASFQPNRHYETTDAYLDAVAHAMRPEYQAIVDAGCVLQIDCPDLAMSRHTGFQDLTDSEFMAQIERQVEALNWALEGIPADRLRMHICWGNYEGPHDHDVALETILPVVMKAKPQAVSFEGSNPRHAHEWSVWGSSAVPDDKILIPGVIDSSTNFVEHPALVAERIQRFASVVGRERVLAGVDCGFGTFAGSGKVMPSIAWKKLASLVEGARIASARLWS